MESEKSHVQDFNVEDNEVFRTQYFETENIWSLLGYLKYCSRNRMLETKEIEHFRYSQYLNSMLNVPGLKRKAHKALRDLTSIYQADEILFICKRFSIKDSKQEAELKDFWLGYLSTSYHKNEDFTFDAQSNNLYVHKDNLLDQFLKQCEHMSDDSMRLRYMRKIIYLNAREFKWISVDDVNHEIAQLPLIANISENLPYFLRQLDKETEFSTWRELTKWARKHYYSEFADQVWPTRSKHEKIIVEYIQDILIHYGEYFSEPYEKGLSEGAIHFNHIIPLTKILREYCLIIRHADKSRNTIRGSGKRTCLRGKIDGYEFFTHENSLAKEGSAEFVRDEFKIANYNRDNLFVYWNDIFRQAPATFNQFKEQLQQIRVWGLHLSNQLDERNGLHLKDQTVGYSSLSQPVEAMINTESMKLANYTKKSRKNCGKSGVTNRLLRRVKFYADVL
ncbi:5901_t:CDS:10 [Acaulospora morrowiae]|uniref:5901_t:CDS:1 n=1 Tax=Acaulospora morrowiae TaxID=94023 RepID=A0A9N9FHZ5_9GLOM|nr:5901_t:CDS:10 [Acaulospora morrowiae]